MVKDLKFKKRRKKMTENKKMKIAVFRFGVISDFVNGSQISRTERRRLLREKCARKYEIPCSEKTRIDKGTIQRWIRIYNKNNGNLEGLYPKERSDKGKSRAMDDDTCLSLSQLRRELPGATIDSLIDQMHQRDMLTQGITLAPTTVYRYLHQQNLMNLTRPAAQDRRKFEAELPNDLWQSDVMHGPRVLVDDKRRKTYLIAIIDDHSRLMTHGMFYLSEALTSYLDALKSALLKRGLPRKLYVDNGPAFRSNHLEYITASLNIALIHAKPYSPQGKGKIESLITPILFL
jgi:putative transposase